MIEMFCDKCGKKIPAREHGGCRVKIGIQEYVFHLDESCQADMLSLMEDELLDGRFVLAPGRKMK